MGEILQVRNGYRMEQATPQLTELESEREDYLFLFCGWRTDRIKALYYSGDGYVLVYKRLNTG